MSKTKNTKKLKREIKSMKRRVRDINKKRQDELQKQRIREIAETAASVSKVVAGDGSVYRRPYVCCTCSGTALSRG